MIEMVVAGVLIIGSWNLTIDSTDLISGAGSDIISPIESLTNQVIIDITDGHPFRDNWRLDVQKIDLIWDANFKIFLARTGDGTAHNRSAISGGLSYQEITDINQSFLSGNGKRSGIPIQVKLEGLSIQTPPALYSTTIVYTFIEL